VLILSRKEKPYFRRSQLWPAATVNYTKSLTCCPEPANPAAKWT